MAISRMAPSHFLWKKPYKCWDTVSQLCRLRLTWIVTNLLVNDFNIISHNMKTCKQSSTLAFILELQSVGCCFLSYVVRYGSACEIIAYNVTQFANNNLAGER